MDSDGNLLADLVREPWVDGAEIEMEQAAMVEAWLDRLLVKILAAAAASFHGVNGGESQGFQSGLKRSGLDRKKLIESNGLEPRQVDLLYRGLYFHSIGMFRVLTELNLGEETAQKVMAAFKLLTSYLPKLEMEPIKYMGNGSSSNRARTKLEVSYMQLVQRTSAEKFARTEEKETFEAKIRELEANVLEKQQEIQSLRETVCERDQEIESCKKSLKDTKLANDALKAVMIRHEEELTRLQEECPDDLKELVRLREENELASKRLADIERQLRRTNDELEDAAFNTAELKKVKGINEKLTSMLATAEKDLNARTKLLNSANESMEKLDRDNYALNELYHEEAKRCAALRLQVQELLEEKEILTRSSMNAKLVAEVEALQKKVQQLLVENENYRSTLAAADKGEVQSLKAVIEGLYMEREDLKGAYSFMKERTGHVVDEMESCTLSLTALDDLLRTNAGVEACTEPRELKELVESARGNALKIISDAKSKEKADLLDAKHLHDDMLDVIKVTTLLKMEKACQSIAEEARTDVKQEFKMKYVQTVTEPNENALSLESFEALERKLETSKLALDSEISLRRSLEDKMKKTAEHIRSMELAYQEMVLSNQALRSEAESTKLNLQSTTSSVSLLKFELQEEKKAHGQTMCSLSALKTDRMNDMDRHSRSIDDLTKHFVHTLEEEKAAHAKTQAHLLQTLEAMKQQAEAAEEHEKTFKSETGRQLQNYRNQISTVIREFQDTVAVCFVGIESVEKLLASEAPKIPSQGTSDTGAFWKALEVLLEALHGIIREGDETLLEPIKTIKHIAEEKTAGMVERASKLVPQLRQRAEECEQCMNSMKNSLTKLQEQAAVSAPSLKSLTRQLWSSWYSSANFARSLHGTVTETVKDALELRKLIDEDTKQNDQSLRYSKLLRGLEEAKSRLELQMDMCSALGQTLSKLFLEIAGRQMREHENEAPETKCGDDRSPFTGLGADSFIKDLAKSLEAEEVSVKERLDLELEMTKLKSKLKSEQVARIWRDKYIREFVNKYNAHFDGSLLVSKEVQTVGPMMFALRPELQNDAAASEFQTYWADLLEQAKVVCGIFSCL
ncbi:hypothetical protein SELMODRAFT_443456 [Selaginella moellendorffii]|uniref:Uncharacterized protein n=1 Tax=Selaginella moellendorffii TaxID=88036 RepID=D8S1M7_SELML|nr:hypothetical protein SELMODRAFT_443456 [Selaginella moellendorffii]